MFVVSRAHWIAVEDGRVLRIPHVVSDKRQFHRLPVNGHRVLENGVQARIHDPDGPGRFVEEPMERNIRPSIAHTATIHQLWWQSLFLGDRPRGLTGFLLYHLTVSSLVQTLLLLRATSRTIAHISGVHCIALITCHTHELSKARCCFPNSINARTDTPYRCFQSPCAHLFATDPCCLLAHLLTRLIRHCSPFS